jgi:hypothetical protein
MVFKSSSSNVCFVVLKVLQYFVFPRSVNWRRLVPPLTQSFTNRLAPINVTMWNELLRDSPTIAWQRDKRIATWLPNRG